jgi:integrase/recombinase XerD
VGKGQQARHRAARHADPRTTTIYEWRRQNFDRHAAYVVVAFVAGG